MPMNYSEVQDTYLRPCVCAEEEPIDTPKSFCYVEGTELDKNTSDNIEELGENVWFESKPPRLFKTDLKPLVTARQVQISRILMNGTRAKIFAAEDNDIPTKGIGATKVQKKRSDKRFLSHTIIDED